MEMKIADILAMSIGDESSKIKVTFRKTVSIKPYETEVIELETELEVDEKISNIERAYITSALLAQQEFVGYVSLKEKGLVTDEEFRGRIKELENIVTKARKNAEALTGKSMSKYDNKEYEKHNKSETA